MGRIPSDAFDAYLALGEDRSYQVLAVKYGVSKRSITKRAARDHWQERLEAIERTARERAEEEYTESLRAVNIRHLKMLRAIQGKSLQALQALPLNSGMDAVRALDLSIKQERLVLGQPGERSAVTGKVEHRLSLAVIAEAVARVKAQGVEPQGLLGEIKLAEVIEVPIQPSPSPPPTTNGHTVPESSNGGHIENGNSA